MATLNAAARNSPATFAAAVSTEGLISESTRLAILASLASSLDNCESSIAARTCQRSGEIVLGAVRISLSAVCDPDKSGDCDSGAVHGRQD